MPDEISGLPFWTLEFRARAEQADPAAIDAFVAGLGQRGITDLFLFSHGWNNDRPTALDLYRRYFARMQALLATGAHSPRRQATIGLAGVIWPSIRWPDERDPMGTAGGAASLDGGDGAAGLGGAASMGGVAAAPRAAPFTPPQPPAERGELADALTRVFTAPGQDATVAALLDRLEAQEPDDAALEAFMADLRALVARESEADDRAADGAMDGAAMSAEDALERDALLADDWHEVLETLATLEPGGEAEGGAAGIGDAFGRLWRGARSALRTTTYWEMKRRAGIVGQEGLGPVIGRAARTNDGLRVHLIGHSFGARLVSYALKGLPDGMTGAASPVKSLLLLQGAFSHFAFADALPHDRSRSGHLRGMAARVDGPLLATHSRLDTAVGRAYPLASIVARQDASAAEDRWFRWGAVGHDGMQAVEAARHPLAPAGTRYPFAPGRWINLDGNQVITQGGPPSGAHSDIVHDETAWASLSAAGVL